MKKLLTALISLFAFTTLAGTFSVSLGWCPSPTVSGYKIYYGTNNLANWLPNVYANPTNCSGILLTNGANWSRFYTKVVNAGTNSVVTISNLDSSLTYYFAAVAYDSSGIESSLSNEIQVKSGKPNAPNNLKIIGVKVIK